MVKRATGWLAMVVVCGGLGGCQSGEDEDQADPISRLDLPDALASVLCDSLADCCSAANYVFDSTNCPAAVRGSVETYLGQRATAFAKYDAQAAGDCVEELKKTAECGRRENALDVGACRRMLNGTQAEGQPCSITVDCSGLGICREDSTTLDRTCVTRDVYFGPVPLRGREGDTCDTTCRDAESCRDSAPIVGCYYEDSLYCDLTCQKFTANGEPCFLGIGPGCEVGSFCDVDSKVCTPSYPNGAACKDAYDCQSEFCAFAAGGSGGTCIAHAVIEQSCATGIP